MIIAYPCSLFYWEMGEFLLFQSLWAEKTGVPWWHTRAFLLKDDDVGVEGQEIVDNGLIVDAATDNILLIKRVKFDIT